MQQRLEKKLNDVNSFGNQIINTKEMITYFKNRNTKSKKKYISYKTLNTVLETVVKFIINGTTSTSITLSRTCIGLIVLPISAVIACTLSLRNKILHILIINKNNKYKKQNEKDQQTIESFKKV